MLIFQPCKIATLPARPEAAAEKPTQLAKAAADGSSRKEHYLPSGFFRDALRTYAGMLSRGSWISFPTSLSAMAPPWCWCCLQSTAGPTRATGRKPCDGAISAELADRESAVSEQINALLGDADAPDRWHYRSLHLAHHPVCADPQATNGWRCEDPVFTTYEGISRLPACWYTSDGSSFGEGDLPHLGLAHQYLNHFRCKSEYEKLLSRTALPVGARKGMVDAMDNSQAAPVVLGPNTCMDLPSDTSFEFVEIRARSLAEHRAWLQILDDTMRRDALIPSQNRGAARTEMGISLTASQSYALLQAMAIQKASLFSTLLQHWRSLTGELLTPPIQPQPQVKEWIELFDKAVISREELRHQLALATANAISSPTLDDSPATRAGESSAVPVALRQEQADAQPAAA